MTEVNKKGKCVRGDKNKNKAAATWRVGLVQLLLPGLAVVAVVAVVAAAALAVDTAEGDAEAALGKEQAEGSCSGQGAHEQVRDGAAPCGCGSLSRDAHSNAAKNNNKYSVEAQGAQNTGKDSRWSGSDTEDGGETADEAQLITIEGGAFFMGSDQGFFPEDGEGPARKVTLSPFRIGAFEVSNERFQKFVEETGYVTEAERFGFSFVVEQFISERVSEGIESAVAAAPWWLPVNGSDWRHPEGPDTAITDRMDHPAIHVSWNDALAFCRWSHPKGRLPTEAEWEFAASGGLKNRTFPWGNKVTPKGRHWMNTWQSTMDVPVERNVFRHSFLPLHEAHAFYSAANSKEDGYALTAPGAAYPPNKFGLYNTVGNVWEWTSDWFTNRHSAAPAVDPTGPATGDTKVKKGGSFMCHQFTCYRYRIAARMHITPDSSAANVGFRCAADV